MMVVIEQDVVIPNTLLEFWSPAVSEAQAYQAMEMVAAYSSEVLGLLLID